VVHYYRQFLVLSQPLLDTQHLTAGARDKIFWRGFYKKDRADTYADLIAEHPRQSTDVYFDYLKVLKLS
jgi:hypothetical protein